MWCASFTLRSNHCKILMWCYFWSLLCFFFFAHWNQKRCWETHIYEKKKAQKTHAQPNSLYPSTRHRYTLVLSSTNHFSSFSGEKKKNTKHWLVLAYQMWRSEAFVTSDKKWRSTDYWPGRLSDPICNIFSAQPIFEGIVFVRLPIKYIFFSFENALLWLWCQITINY